MTKQVMPTTTARSQSKLAADDRKREYNKVPHAIPRLNLNAAFILYPLTSRAVLDVEKSELYVSVSILTVITLISMRQRHDQAPAAGASREEGVIAVHFPGITVEQITDLKAQLQLRFAPVQLMT